MVAFPCIIYYIVLAPAGAVRRTLLCCACVVDMLRGVCLTDTSLSLLRPGAQRAARRGHYDELGECPPTTPSGPLYTMHSALFARVPPTTPAVPLYTVQSALSNIFSRPQVEQRMADVHADIEVYATHVSTGPLSFPAGCAGGPDCKPTPSHVYTTLYSYSLSVRRVVCCRCARARGGSSTCLTRSST